MTLSNIYMEEEKKLKYDIQKTRVCNCEGCDKQGDEQSINDFYYYQNRRVYDYICKDCRKKVNRNERAKKRKKELELRKEKNTGFLQVKKSDDWIFVYFINKYQGKKYVQTTQLLSKAKCGDKLEYYQKVFPEREFRVVGVN